MKNDIYSLLVGMLLVMMKYLTKSSTSLLVCVQTFKSVASALWAVNEAIAKHVAETIYEKMFKGFGRGTCLTAGMKATSALNQVMYSEEQAIPRAENRIHSYRYLVHRM